MDAKWRLVTFLVFVLVILGWPTEAYAHGVEIEYTSSVSIEVFAKYDTGEPMSNAQVVVYAPDDPTTPWLTGSCDEGGRFTFVPDSSKPGTWDIQIRKAGHGGMVHVPVGEGMVATGATGGYSASQIVLMAVCVVWGIAGTALYFKGRKA